MYLKIPLSPLDNIKIQLLPKDSLPSSVTSGGLHTQLATVAPTTLDTDEILDRTIVVSISTGK